MKRVELLQDAKPIPFTAEMARAILDGKKTQTRRVIKPLTLIENIQDIWNIGRYKNKRNEKCQIVMGEHYTFGYSTKISSGTFRCDIPMKYVEGDICYVKETWGIGIQATGGIIYKTDYIDVPRYKVPLAEGEKWKSSRFMPKSVARTFIRIAKVRAEQLQDISHDDVLAEGIRSTVKYPVEKVGRQTIFDIVDCKNQFEDLWERVNGLGAWESNPWVFVYEFERVE